MFDTAFALRLHGAAGSILWGYRPAATIRSWAIAKQPDGQWLLTALLDRCEAFQLRQRPLLFTAPRAGGFWCWGIESIEIVGALHLTARLGPPEQ